MRANVDGFRGSLTVDQFKGGQSNPTYRVEAGGTRYVVRRKPPGQLLPSAHAVDREYRVLSALQGTGVPVPRTYALCTDPSILGTWFYVMECVEGRVLWDPHLPDLSPRERFAIYDSLNEVLARLHSLDPARSGSPTTAGRGTTSRASSRAGRSSTTRRSTGRTRRWTR